MHQEPHGLPEYVVRVPAGLFRGLNPTTKLVVALAIGFVALGVRGWTGPLAMLALIGTIVVAAGIGRGIVPYALATLPILVSIILVNTFLYPGATDTLVDLGPVSATGTGLVAAVQAALRVVAFALAVGVLALTTPMAHLLDDLERRGVGRRLTFVVGSAVGMIPRMMERAREITDAQRARGMDTEGSPARRIRGVLPLAGPMVLSSLAEVEERTMALEARGFSAPGARVTLRPFADHPAERLLRWVAGIGALVLVFLSVAGIVAVP